jgi:hypothetical protein
VTFQLIKLRRGLAAEWTDQNPILQSGEPGVELDTGLMKFGNGLDHWVDLPYTYGEESSSLSAHIDSELPHPVYDDGASFVLLYENAKV